MSASSVVRPANFTRRSASLPRKFLREGQPWWLPIYWVLRLSDLAREGMDRSGSYRFADHLYAGVPSGRGVIGRWLDAVLLKLPATRSMRSRYVEAQTAMLATFEAHLTSGTGEPFRVLTVPCGIPRDVRDFVRTVEARHPGAAARIHYTGMDIDAEVIAAAREFLVGSPLGQAEFRTGNALERPDFPAVQPHFISSTGLGEFLPDAQLASFYENVFAQLAPGGTFYTSAAARGRGSDLFLRAFELEANYRTEAQLRLLLARLPWAALEFTRDAVGLQTFVRARKPS